MNEIQCEIRDIKLKDRNKLVFTINIPIPNRRYGGDIRFDRRSFTVLIDPVPIEVGDKDVDAQMVNANA